MNADLAASEIYEAYKEVAGIEGTPAGDFAQRWANAYNDYASGGIVLGATNTGGNIAALEAFLTAPKANDATVITDFANALVAFWSAVAVTPGVPAHGGVAVSSVTNNAALKLTDFVSAINASIVDADTQPYFVDLIENIESMAVANIEWTVIETMGNGAQVPFVESIS